MKLRSVFIIALVVVVAGIAFHAIPGRNRAERSLPRSAEPGAPRAAPAPVAQDSASPPLPPAGLSPSLRQVFPELTAPIADWRNWTPARITVAPFPGVPIPFALVRLQRGVDQSGTAYTTWIGRPVQDLARPAAGWHLVGVATAHGWQAVLTTPAGIFDVVVRGNEAFVAETHDRPGCGVPPSVPPNGRVGPEELVVYPSPHPGTVGAGAVQFQTFGAARAVTLPRNPTDAVQPLAADIHVLDIVVFYDQTAEEKAKKGFITSYTTSEAVTVPPVPAAGVGEFMAARYRAAIEACNLVLEDSGVTNLRWNLLGTFATASYVPDGRLQSDLAWFGGTTQEPGISANARIKQLGADLGVLITGERSDYPGIAGIYRAAIEISGSYLVLAHEVGHCLGLSHDRVTDGIPDHDPRYNVGYLFNYWFNGYSSSVDGVIRRDWRLMPTGDLMSYATLRLPYFSSPALTITGTTIANEPNYTTDDTRYPLGVGAGQARPADAARHLRETAATHAGSRQADRNGKPPEWIVPPPPTVTGVSDSQFVLNFCAANADRYQFIGDDGQVFLDLPIGYAGGYLPPGSRRCFIRAKNEFGSADSPEFTLVIIARESKPPTITTPPASVRIASSGLLLLSVGATNVDSYQWLRNGRPVGTNSFEFVDVLATPADAGTYSVKVSNAFGSVESAPASVTVTTDAGTAPVFTSVPSPGIFDSRDTSISFSLDFAAAGATNYQVHEQFVRGRRALAGGYQVFGGGAPTPIQATLFFAEAANGSGGAVSAPVIAGYRSPGLISGLGTGVIVARDVRHANGTIFDQTKLEAGYSYAPYACDAVTAAPGKVTRTSFVDVDGDIVQVEFSGAGTLSLRLADVSFETSPRKYYQPGVAYASGRAGLIVVDADETTNLSIFTVGRATAFDPTGAYDILQPISGTNDPARNGSSLFNHQDATVYDGVADVFYVAILSRNGKFGGLRAANARFSANFGYVGVYAPGVAFTGPLYIGDIAADSEARPILAVGSVADARITGGDMLQENGAPVEVAGITSLLFSAGVDSAGRTLPARINRAKFVQAGVDVTSAIVRSP